MRLLLQFGYGMQEASEHLAGVMPDTGVILSPRDIVQRKAVALSSRLRKKGCSIFLDPQIYALSAGKALKYIPKYDFWPSETDILKLNWESVVHGLEDLGDLMESEAVILPAPYTKKIDTAYLNAQDRIVSCVSKRNRPVYMTLCLSPRVLSSERDATFLLSKADEWDVDGYYVIPERPDGDYLTDDPLWMANLLRLCAGLKLKGKKVVVGYASHQLLALSCAGVDAIAAGTYMNVRSFTIDKFMAHQKKDYAKRKAWYYCPQALSEFSVQYLDIAFARQQLSVMRPMIPEVAPYVGMLFSRVRPSATSFSESGGFRHYLVCLGRQCRDVSRSTMFSKRYESVRNLYVSAAELLRFLHKYEIRGQSRDFEDFVDVSISALDMFKEDHGFLLDRMPQCFAS